MDQIPSCKLNTGASIPQIGFGTWKLADGAEAYGAVRDALTAGYCLIDTAKYYGNEESVGRAIRESGIAREEIFITTKLWPTDFLDPRKAFEKSFERLGLEYIDLYLIHWPVPGMPKSVWRALEKIFGEKLARAIGVSNYGIGDIEKVLNYANTPPAVDQVKCNPLDYPEEVLRLCKKHGIVVEAYSPLNRGALESPAIERIAQARGKSAAQVMLRWCIEHGAVPIPKTTRPDRMKENLGIFDWSLSEADMRALDELSS